MAGSAAAHHVEPVLRDRMLRTFRERFASPVTLDQVRVHYDGMLQVDGSGLRVQSVVHGITGDPAHPMLRVQEFHFRVGLWAALSPSPRIHHVRIRGVELDLPRRGSDTLQVAASTHEVDLEYAEVDDAHIHFAAGAPDLAPLTFDLLHLEMRGVNRSKPIRVKAVVDNGDRMGTTELEGTVGPWNFADPRLTPVQGTFAAKDIAMDNVPGLRGQSSLQGRMEGAVGHFRSQGTTTDPRFGLDVSSRTFLMKTNFAFTLDATRGEIDIESIQARFGSTDFSCTGRALKNRDPQGFRLELHLHSPAARVEDVLALASRTAPPLLRGSMTLDGQLLLRAGPESVARRLALDHGRLAVTEARFSNVAAQQTAGELATRAEGKDTDAAGQAALATTAELHGPVELRDQTLRFSNLRLTSPGTQASLHGTYALNQSRLRLDGIIHTDAEMSHLAGGLRGMLLKPFNGLFHHGRDGATLPLHVEGAGGVPHFSTSVGGFKVTPHAAK